MIQVIVAAHGKLAAELVNSSEMVFGEVEGLHGVTFVPGEGQDTLVENMKRLSQNVIPPIRCYFWWIYSVAALITRQLVWRQNAHKMILSPA
ncbi:PTS system mannose-specific EIIAB component [Rodentibacter pneumotropicus]|uniref:PTS system mannose-specific EIIAB component n=1 Tax=Rodentibacter pneumotropicus TaxID=758 RepID=A0A448MR80_9PAST|nr:PTS system mannose-specific EIIAB component [Rodentibacter pneumotropicus]